MLAPITRNRRRVLGVAAATLATGGLSAQIIEHDIISLRRADILAWLAASDVQERAGRVQINS
jgi:hypothetical protein